jgi:NAD(P)-dependent dehydrogenase (short-subunit alcohol dehydrogenase family)
MTEKAHPSSAAYRHATRAAIVTGGAGAGIGHGLTTVLAHRDWAVLIVDRDSASAETLQRTLAGEGFPVELLGVDIAAEGAPAQAVERALALYGRLDGLVNNAGIGLCKPSGEIRDDEFDRVLDVDLRAVFRFCRAAIPELASTGGSIVNIGSVHAHATFRGYAVYAAAKAAVEAFTRGLAADYGPQGVRANCINPGLVMSPQNRDLIAKFASNVEACLEAYVRTKQLVPVLPTAEQVGELAAFLMSEHAQAITGQAFTIDGGTSVMLYEREPCNQAG